MLSVLVMFMGIILLFAFGATFLIGGMMIASALGILIPIAIVVAIIKFLFGKKKD